MMTRSCALMLVAVEPLNANDDDGKPWIFTIHYLQSKMSTNGESLPVFAEFGHVLERFPETGALNVSQARSLHSRCPQLFSLFADNPSELRAQQFYCRTNIWWIWDIVLIEHAGRGVSWYL